MFNVSCCSSLSEEYPDSKVHGANMGATWSRQDPGGPHVGPMNLAIWVYTLHETVSSDIKSIHTNGWTRISVTHPYWFVSKQPDAICQIAIDLSGLPYIDLSYVDQRPYQLKHLTLSKCHTDEWIPWLCILHHWTSVVSFDIRIIFPCVFVVFL